MHRNFGTYAITNCKYLQTSPQIPPCLNSPKRHHQQGAVRQDAEPSYPTVSSLFSQQSPAMQPPITSHNYDICSLTTLTTPTNKSPALPNSQISVSDDRLGSEAEESGHPSHLNPQPLHRTKSLNALPQRTEPYASETRCPHEHARPGPRKEVWVR